MSDPAQLQIEESAGDPKVPAYSWYALSILVVVYVLNFVDRNIISILAEDIKADLGLRDDQIGFLYGTAFGVFYALFGIPLGKLADSWNRVRLMTAGLAIWSAFTALSGFAKNFAMLSVARIGVGVGEATASPSAYSLISDWFPKKMRATALAIYSSGLYVGGGVSLLIGGAIVERWNAAYPVDAPLGLAGWQAAFIIVGLPGLLLAVLVATLREPLRGQSEGITTPPPKDPFRGFFRELVAVIPPFTLIGAAQAGGRGIALNLAGALVIGGIAYAMAVATDNYQQWGAVGIGYYAIFSWASTLKRRDEPTFRLIWGTPAFLTTILGYGMVAFMSYAASFWAAPYAIRILEEAPSTAGWWIGGPGAVAGFLGVIFGGRAADWLRERNPAGRLIVVAFGLTAAAPFLFLMFTTDDPTLFYIAAFFQSLFGSSALGGAAATTQDLVLPRMRGTATATFFLATTLVGLALGPYMAGQVSTMTGSLTTGGLSLLMAVPIGLVLLAIAYRTVPTAEQSVIQRSVEAGEALPN
ncbi:MFS transporter [Altererythrobacter sp.]|uniref:spinster family MFS transporter n=1 Tax=Altererythrobacter sp. TaxID=1872480 RepID=UPI001B114156|nr:MFS transporter [Altererythrobacter sp.]MBO6608432.1 MFS transporter [Altererythrobacter sp.]MBO6642054.1 MFS transporter [Altererythrobacter sp.]MBO6709438.1 MFS transporter [Altererythrobacter sp.]MBO6944455.1 MFS transporter [Altererythrobacter sp.]